MSLCRDTTSCCCNRVSKPQGRGSASATFPPPVPGDWPCAVHGPRRRAARRRDATAGRQSRRWLSCVREQSSLTDKHGGDVCCNTRVCRFISKGHKQAPKTTMTMSVCPGLGVWAPLNARAGRPRASSMGAACVLEVTGRVVRVLTSSVTPHEGCALTWFGSRRSAPVARQDCGSRCLQEASPQGRDALPRPRSWPGPCRPYPHLAHDSPRKLPGASRCWEQVRAGDLTRGDKAAGASRDTEPQHPSI